MSASQRPVYRHDQMRRVLHPDSIAVLGASSRPGAFGERTLFNLAQFEGRVYPVNPRYETVHDLKCYPDVRSLPEVPDCAVICAAREAVEEIVVQCAAEGVGGAIIFASGYAEVGLPERVAQQQRLSDISRESGMRIIGPNCMGAINVVRRSLVTFATMDPIPQARDRNIGLVSQSGALGFSLAQAATRGVSFSHVLMSGNSCDIDMSDYIAYLADEPACQSIACAFEGSSNPERLLEAAEIAWKNNKPLVIFKIATSEQGAAAAMSHTGSLAGAHVTYLAALRRAGAIVVDHHQELIGTAAFFAKAKQPSGKGVAVLAVSGGSAIMAADSAAHHSVTLPQPPAELKALLESHIPDFGVAGNPVDVTGQVLNKPESYTACAAALLAHPDYAALVVPALLAVPRHVPLYAIFDQLAREAGKLVCYPWVSEYFGGPGEREIETADNLALFRSMDHCFATLAMWQWREQMRAQPRVIPERLTNRAAQAQATQLIRAQRAKVSTEREAKALLALYGVPVVGEMLAQSATEAAVAAETLGFPVVLKAESSDLPHKTEAGVIRLGLKSAAEVREAYEIIVKRANAVVPKPLLNGVLVQPMVPQGIEMMIGGRVDPLFGPLIIVGLGGIFVELMKDTVLLPAPVSRNEALQMIRSLKGFKALQGFRNLSRVDLDRLAEIVCRTSQFIADQGELIAELDVNPLICVGDQITAVDALIIKRDSRCD